MQNFVTFGPEIKIPKRVFPYITFPIINSCTLKCQYCGDGGEMPSSLVKQFDADELLEWHSVARSLGIEKFRITGGEPLLHKEFEKILDGISRDAKIVLINTNGTLIKKNFSKWTKSPSNCKYVVNYHGATESTFNKVTATNGYFYKVRCGIELLSSKNLLHRLNIVLCKLNIDEIYQVIEYCKQLRCDLKIQDVVSVPWQFADYDDIYLDTTAIEREFEKRATSIFEHDYAMYFGTPCKIYQIDGVNVTLKSVRNGSHYDMQGVCGICEYYPCHEGVYDLFVFPDNTSAACNWTPISKAPVGEKRMQLEWLVRCFQNSVWRNATSNIIKMNMPK